MKKIKIPINDLVEEEILFEDSVRYLELSDQEKKAQMLAFRQRLDVRFEELFGIISMLSRKGHFDSKEIANMADAYSDMRKEWNKKRYLFSFLNFPKLDDSKQPEVIILVKDLILNENKFNFIVENSTVNQIELTVEEAIRIPDKFRGKDEDPPLRGVWFNKHLKAIKNAEKID
jgi:hypothetical protein